MDFGGLGSIDGDLIADTANNVATLTANSVQNITGQFKLNNMSALYTLNMQQLRGVGQGNSGGINWQGLPLLQQVNFGNGLDSATGIDIENSQIQDLSPLNVKIANMVRVANNPSLTGLNWATTNATNFTVAGNGLGSNGINVTLNNLQGVTSLTIRNASSLSLPSLQQCANLFLVESGGLTSLDLPNMTSTGGISVSNSPQLTNVSLPALQTCQGGLKLINNDNLGGTIQFPALTQLRGDLNITGAFQGVQMPQINTIQGTSYLWSTQDIDSTCAQFGSSGSYAGSKIQGKPITCTGNHDSAAAGGGTATKGGSSGSQSSGAAIANFIAQPASLFGATGLFAAVLGMM